MRRTIPPLLGALALLAASAAPAAAQMTDNSLCRASVARANLVADPTLINSEPVLANGAGTICTTQAVSTAERTTVGPATTELAAAFTRRGDLGTGGALASTTDATVTLGDLTVTAQAVQASALVSCAGTRPVLSGTSRVTGLTINGNAVVLPTNDGFLEVDLGPLGRVALNEQIVEGTKLTRRALAITTPLGDVVLGEAIAGHGPEACVPPAVPRTTTDTGGDLTGIPGVCPDGSTYDQSRRLCVIVRRDASGTQSVIVVGRPFDGPGDGRVVALEDLPAHFRNLPCAKGPGAKFAIIGTGGADRITGTNRNDRMFTGGGRDQVSGGRGNDCIDGGLSSDVLGGDHGTDRLYGGRGKSKDALRGGYGADRMLGGRGNDTMIDGFGDDRVSGGPGRDAVNVAQAGSPALRVRCGKGRDILRINRNERRRHRGCERVYVIR